MSQIRREIDSKPVPCISCGKPIARGNIIEGRIEIPCRHCKTVNVIEARQKPEHQRVPAL